MGTAKSPPTSFARRVPVALAVKAALAVKVDPMVRAARDAMVVLVARVARAVANHGRTQTNNQDGHLLPGPLLPLREERENRPQRTQAQEAINCRALSST